MRLEHGIHATFGKCAASALHLLNARFANPAITVEKAAATGAISCKSVNVLVAQMQQHGCLQEMKDQSRHRIFLFEHYPQAFESP